MKYKIFKITVVSLCLLCLIYVIIVASIYNNIKEMPYVISATAPYAWKVFWILSWVVLLFPLIKLIKNR